MTVAKFWLNTFINFGEGFNLVGSVPLIDKPNSRTPVQVNMAETHAELMKYYAHLKSGDEVVISESPTVRVTIRHI